MSVPINQTQGRRDMNDNGIGDSKREYIARTALPYGAVVTALIGVWHMFMPTAGYAHWVVHSMPTPIADHFYYLGTYAIGVFLSSFACLSLTSPGIFATRPFRS
ncbi:MAG TPA: hypothetical protein VN154_01105 [Rhizomicrobium sp.]|nr:hypothetical protein [Rhizomicrobium sp.]